MVKAFGSIADYLRNITIANSDALGWKSIKVSVAADASNCVRFDRLRRNTIKLSLSGTARHCVRVADVQDARPTKAGEVMLLPAGLSVELSWVTLGPVEQTIVVEFDDDVFDTYCPEIIIDRVPTGDFTFSGYSDKIEISTLIKMLARELDESTRRGPRFAEMTIRLLTHEIANSDWYRSQIRPAGKSDVRSRIARVIATIDSRLETDISVAELAEDAGMSKSHLIALFKSRTGRSPYAYLLDRRIEKAAALLRATSRPIADIAIECGFLDQSQMTKLFKRRLGITPRAYRLEELHENDG